MDGAPSPEECRRSSKNAHSKTCILHYLRAAAAFFGRPLAGVGKGQDHRSEAHATSLRRGTKVTAGFFVGTEMPDADWWESLWSDAAGVLAAVGMTPGLDVIDLCSGDGWFTLQIAKSARTVTAIDIDSKLLEQSRVRLTENGVSNCAFANADAYDISKVVPRRVDFVFLANAFHGVPDKKRLAAAVVDSLKVGSRFAIVNWHKRPREETTVLGQPRGPRSELRMSPDEVVTAVSASGLHLERVVEIPPYHYGAVFQRS